jgi:succinate dehydrogenase flavin-adding protein (antitoxin of CptAB toxin-antitoxin module)
MNMQDTKRRKLERVLDIRDRALFMYYLGYDPLVRDGF